MPTGLREQVDVCMSGAPVGPRSGAWRLGRALLGGAALAALVWLPRLVQWDQPLVENAVGRQIPTAMVARNLERGAGFLYPRLDTGPFPNWFLVEPPVYQALVIAVRRTTGLGLEAAGRVTSAAGFALGCVGLWALVWRRLGAPWAAWVVAVYALLPVCVRYGRAFQPDAVAVGLALAGLALWDQWRVERRWWVGGLGWLAVAAGVSVKVLGAFVLAPLGVLLWSRSRERSRLRLIALLASHLVLALCWYAHAWGLLREGSGASRENAQIWLSVLVPTALSRWETWRAIGSIHVVRAFTPVAVALAAVGVVWGRAWLDRFWLTWGGSALAMLLLVGAKLHHEYYALWLAPFVSVAAVVGCRRLVATIERRWRWVAVSSVAVVYAALALRLSWSTWRAPGEWRGLGGLSAVRSTIPVDALVVAREAVLYTIDRRGMRLESTDGAIVRALGEWGVRVPIEEATPETLLSWYDRLGATHWVDVGDPEQGRLTTCAAAAARRLARKTLIDEPGVLVVELGEASDVEHTEDSEADPQ